MYERKGFMHSPEDTYLTCPRCVGCSGYLPQILDIISSQPNAILVDSLASRDNTSLLAITKTHNFEEDIWSPMYGMRGKLDATVEAIIQDPGLPPFPRKPMVSKGPRPLEIKTGGTAAGMEHRAQTILYTLLTAERYGVDVPVGLLYYTQKDEVVMVRTNRNEVRGLLIARNEMANSMVRRDDDIKKSNAFSDVKDFLPETIDDPWLCNRCYAVDICMLYRKVYWDDLGISHCSRPHEGCQGDDG